MLKVNAGEDPTHENKAKRLKPAIEELARKYLELHAKINKKTKGYTEDRAMLQNIILKSLGTLKVEEITSQDILKIHKNLKKTQQTQYKYIITKKKKTKWKTNENNKERIKDDMKKPKQHKKQSSNNP